jgi:hypothetical protein
MKDEKPKPDMNQPYYKSDDGSFWDALAISMIPRYAAEEKAKGKNQ